MNAAELQALHEALTKAMEAYKRHPGANESSALQKAVDDVRAAADPVSGHLLIDGGAA